MARLLRGRLDNVLTYLQHGVTNAVSEGLNSRLQGNQQNFIIAVYFHCGGLDLDPDTANH